jgi:hypothetical protein
MSFLKRVFGRGCSHRLTWPRLGNNGQHYQICLDCGVAYEYDWQGMRLTGRLLATVGRQAFNEEQPGSLEPRVRL